MELQHILDMLVPVVTIGITVVGVWVRKLIDEIHSLNVKMKTMDDTMSREHGDVLAAINQLSGAVTTEVRGIVQQHSEHDKQNTRIEVKIDTIKEKIGGLSRKEGCSCKKASHCKCSH